MKRKPRNQAKLPDVFGSPGKAKPPDMANPFDPAKLPDIAKLLEQGRFPELARLLENGKLPDKVELPGLPPINVVSQEEAEQCTMVVCNTADMPSWFVDNVETDCALCGVGIYHRPHVPKNPPKVCIHCALKLAGTKPN